MKKICVFIIGLLVSSMFLGLFQVGNVYAADPELPVTEDFENWNVNNWDGSSPDVISASAETGTYGLNLNSTWSSSSIWKNCDATEADALKNATITFSARVRQLNLQSDWHVEFCYADSYYQGLIFVLGLSNNATGDYFWFGTEVPSVAGGGSEYFENVGDEIVLDQWYHFKVNYLGSKTAGVLQCFIGSELVYSYSGATMTNNEDDWGIDGSLNWLMGLLYSMASSSINMDIDNINITEFSGGIIVSADDLENIDQGADWVFTNWRYYTFTATVVGMPDLSELIIYFNVTTGSQGVVSCAIDAQDDETWQLATTLTAANINRYGQPLLIQAGSWSSTEVTFKIWFTDQCLDEFGDPIDVYAWGNQTTGIETSLLLAADGLFYIYSKGGFTKNYATSNATNAFKLAGGEWNSLYAQVADTPESYTSVQNEIWFRDLQHVKMLPDVRFLAGYEPFFIRYEVDYSLGNGAWTQGWRVDISPKFTSYTGIFASNVWVNMTVEWYQGNGTGETWIDVKTDNIYMFYHGGVDGAGDQVRWQFWVDMWFNSINASSTGGGRVNAYEYPMNDLADLWLRWLANNWGVKDDVEKESSYMGDLLDGTGDGTNIISTEAIRMVRVKEYLYVYQEAGGGQIVQVSNLNVMDYTRSPQLPLTGVQTPVFDETKMPTVGNTGVLGAIFSMFSGIGQWLSENIVFGGLNLWGNFVNFLDTIAGWLGAPKFFSNLFTWIGEQLSHFVDGVGYAFSLVGSFFLLIGSLLGSFLTTVGEMIASFLTTISMILGIMGGTIGGAGDLWNQLGISSWITLALILYPLYLIILWEERGMDAVMNQLGMIFGILSWLYNFFISLGTFILNMITGLIESIPVAE